MERSQLVATYLTALLMVSVLAVGVLATERQTTTEITACTTISESGNYKLGNDITYGGDDCIIVQADDVTIDGNGHSIVLKEAYKDEPIKGAPIKVDAQENVRIHDVTFSEEAHLRVSDSTGVTLENNHFRGFADLFTNRDLTIRENYFNGSNAEIQGVQGLDATRNRIEDGRINVNGNASDVTVRDNHGEGRILVEVSQGAAIVVNNTIHESAPVRLNDGNSIRVRGADGTSITVARNDVANGENGITVRADGSVRVHNNTVEKMTNYGIHLAGTSENISVTHNTVIDSDVGVHISGGYETGMPVTVEWNVITDNRIGVLTNSNLPDIHHNDLSANSHLGASYTQDNGVVNATSNYWGDRPSSTDDEHAPFEDPVTETLANGTGSAVSEGSAPAGVEPGVSNVHFDPWLDTAPDAGVQQPSDGDDSKKTTTTSTTTTTTSTKTKTTTTSTTTTTTASTTTTAPTTRSTTPTTTGTTTSDDTTTTTVSDDTTATTATTKTTTASTTAATTTTTTATTATDDTTTTASDEDTTTTTARGNEETTTTSPTPTGNQTTIITGTTTTDAPGFDPLLGILALMAGVLLAARER